MLKDLNAYRNTEEKFFVLDESIDPGTKFKREINTLFKTDDVRETLNKIWDSVDENAKQILLDTIDEEFLDKYATDDGSGKKKKEADEDSSEDDFKFEKDGSKLNEPDDGSEDNGDDFGDGKETEVPPDASAAPAAQEEANNNPFMAVK